MAHPRRVRKHSGGYLNKLLLMVIAASIFGFFMSHHGVVPSTTTSSISEKKDWVADSRALGQTRAKQTPTPTFSSSPVLDDDYFDDKVAKRDSLTPMSTIKRDSPAPVPIAPVSHSASSFKSLQKRCEALLSPPELMPGVSGDGDGDGNRDAGEDTIENGIVVEKGVLVEMGSDIGGNDSTEKDASNVAAAAAAAGLSCQLPAVDLMELFSGPCFCQGRLLRHVASGLYICDRLGRLCGGVSWGSVYGSASSDLPSLIAAPDQMEERGEEDLGPGEDAEEKEADVEGGGGDFEVMQIPSAKFVRGGEDGVGVDDSLESLSLRCADLTGKRKWTYGCKLPVSDNLGDFTGSCACEGRMLRHRKSGMFRCERLPASCGGASFEDTLGYKVNMGLYDEVDVGEITIGPFFDLISALQGRFQNIETVQKIGEPDMEMWKKELAPAALPVRWRGGVIEAWLASGCDWTCVKDRVGDMHLLKEDVKHMTVQQWVEALLSGTSMNGFADLRPWHLPGEKIMETLGFDFPPFYSPSQYTTPNVWMGRKGASTGLHKDTNDNFIYLLLGRKSYTIFPPTDYKYLYLKDPKYGRNLYGQTSLLVWSRVNDAFKPDLTRFPRYQLAHPVTVELSAGDVMFLPAGWIHQVHNMEDSMVINFWRTGLPEALVGHPAPHYDEKGAVLSPKVARQHQADLLLRRMSPGNESSSDY